MDGLAKELLNATTTTTSEQLHHRRTICFMFIIIFFFNKIISFFFIFMSNQFFYGNSLLNYVQYIYLCFFFPYLCLFYLICIKMRTDIFRAYGFFIYDQIMRPYVISKINLCRLQLQQSRQLFTSSQIQSKYTYLLRIHIHRTVNTIT